MKKKIVGIIVLMLVATAVVSATNVNMEESNNITINSEPYEGGLFDWWSVDQKQTITEGYGNHLFVYTLAQEFKPTKEKLTAVSIYLFKYGTPPDPVYITVHIRDNLTGSDLVNKTIDTSVVTIKNKATWVLFDFEDIIITPEKTYYIVCSADAGDTTNAYCWLFSYNDTYPRGICWWKPGPTWIPDPPTDFCFKTHFRKPLDISVPINNENLVNHWLLSMFERFPNAFPILRHLIGY